MADRPSASEKKECTRCAVDARAGLLGYAFWIYKSLFSPLMHAIAPSRCLYLPTCSEYAYIAARRFGMVRGASMALRRFARCHPWGEGGLDPVPERCVAGRSTCSGSGQKSPEHLP